MPGPAATQCKGPAAAGSPVGCILVGIAGSRVLCCTVLCASDHTCVLQQCYTREAVRHNLQLGVDAVYILMCDLIAKRGSRALCCTVRSRGLLPRHCRSPPFCIPRPGFGPHPALRQHFVAVLYCTVMYNTQYSTVLLLYMTSILYCKDVLYCVLYRTTVQYCTLHRGNSCDHLRNEQEGLTVDLWLPTIERGGMASVPRTACVFLVLYSTVQYCTVQ